MFTANIIGKEALENGTTKIEVQFTDGTTTTPSEFVIPSDSYGLEYFIKGRLDALNFVAPPPGVYVPPVVIAPQIPQEEIDRTEWLANAQRYLRIKTLLDAGVLTAGEADLEGLLGTLKGGFTPDYLNYM